MNNGRFQILMKRRQNRYTFPDEQNESNVVVQCDPNTGFAQYIKGDVDNSTPFENIVPVDGWYDFGNYIEPDGINKLQFTWDKVNSGNSTNSTTNQDGSNYDKGLTSDLTFFDASYKFIYDWLLKSECSILNAVEVKIIDLIAGGTYRIFEIKSDNLEYAPVEDPCQFFVKLREQDGVWHCIHKTFIWDNWQGWFKDDSIKEHPCFLTCIEPRPRLVQSARMALMLFFQSIPAVVGFNFITGNKIKNDAGKILNANRFVDAPLVRTYIENVAGKCGLTMDTIFDIGQEFENLCLYFPQAGYMHEIESDEEFETVVSPSLSFHFDNRWLITIAELFDKLKVVLAAEWYVTPLNKIVFKHKKDLINLDPIYDFTAVGAEPIYDLRYSFNGEKKPAYGRYEYTTDGSDLASQEVSPLYNDIVDYDGPANNPMLEGERVKNFEFAPTGFVRDGRAKDYIKLLIKDGKTGALILIAILVAVAYALGLGLLTAGAGVALTLFTIIPWVGAIILKTNGLMNFFVNDPLFTGAVRLTSEQTLAPRLILWDGINMQRAKAVATIGLPKPNVFYNPHGTPYDEKNKIDQDNPSHTIYNYPMYFDGDYLGNLFPKYHDIIDNPLKSLETHQDVKWNVDLCEGMLNLFGVFENQYAQIGKIVKLEHRDGYDVYVRIGNINVDYDSGKIDLKGTVLRRRIVPIEETTIPVGPGGGGEVQDTFPVGGEFPEGTIPTDDTHEEIPVCLKWTNNGFETAEGVQYIDCSGNFQSQDISVGENFCSIAIISEGTGGNIVATDICDNESSGSGVVETGCCYFAPMWEVDLGGDNPVSGTNVFTHPDFVGAQAMTYIIYNKVPEFLDEDYTFDSVTGMITRVNNFETGDKLVTPYKK